MFGYVPLNSALLLLCTTDVLFDPYIRLRPLVGGQGRGLNWVRWAFRGGLGGFWGYNHELWHDDLGWIGGFWGWIGSPREMGRSSMLKIQPVSTLSRIPETYHGHQDLVLEAPTP